LSLDQYGTQPEQTPTQSQTFFTCDVCGRTFKSQLAVNTHKGLVHKEPQQYNCVTCNLTFNSKHALKVHNGIVHTSNSVRNFTKSVSQNGTSNNRGIKVLDVDTSKFYVLETPRYVEQDSELKILEAHWKSQVPLLFVGPKGVGKTLSIAHFARINTIPIVQYDCSEDSKRWDLVGRFVDVGTYELGVMPLAIEVANREGKCILVFEELNALSPNMQKTLNQLLDWRRHVYVPELNKVYRLEPNAKLLIAATMNPSTYGGVFELNEDLRSRFAEYHVTYPRTDVEQKVVSMYDGLPDDLVQKLITLANESRAGTLSYVISPRDLTLFATLYKTYTEVFGQDKALRMALKTTVIDRFNEEEVKTWVKPRIFSIFGIEV